MLKVGNVTDNIITMAIIIGLGYIIYIKAKSRGTGTYMFKNLFGKAGDLVHKVNIKK